MKGKDWFIVGTRLLGMGILYFGFQQGMTFLTRGMLFANLEHSFLFDTTPPWMYLLNGALTSGFALVLLLKTESLADWCYGKEEQLDDEHDYDEVGDTRQDPTANEE
jgi:hypothetical protein